MWKKNKIIKIVCSLIVVIVILLIVVAVKQSQLDDQKTQSSLPSIVQTCKEYLYENDFAKKDSIDYSIYHTTDLTYEGYLEANFFTEEKISEENIENYSQVVIGDTQVGKMGEHNYAVLLVDKRTETVRGYAPVK